MTSNKSKKMLLNISHIRFCPTMLVWEMESTPAPAAKGSMSSFLCIRQTGDVCCFTVGLEYELLPVWNTEECMWNTGHLVAVKRLNALPLDGMTIVSKFLHPASAIAFTTQEILAASAAVRGKVIEPQRDSQTAETLKSVVFVPGPCTERCHSF